MASLKKPAPAEEEYFARIEFERRQKKLEAEHEHLKVAAKKKLKETHWMRCPKCGMEMVELEFEGVKIDKCTKCLGIYLDDGELDLLSAPKNKGALSRFAGLFK